MWFDWWAPEMCLYLWIKNWIILQVVVTHTFNVSSKGQRQTDICEFKVNLVYRASSEQPRVHTEKACLKNNKQTNNWILDEFAVTNNSEKTSKSISYSECWLQSLSSTFDLRAEQNLNLSSIGVFSSMGHILSINVGFHHHHHHYYLSFGLLFPQHATDTV